MNKKRTRNVDWKERRRYRAVELNHVGWTHEEIAEALDVSTRAVKQWMKVVREEGKAGLQAHPQPGATPKLAAEELAILTALAAGVATLAGNMYLLMKNQEASQKKEVKLELRKDIDFLSRLAYDLDSIQKVGQ